MQILRGDRRLEVRSPCAENRARVDAGNLTGEPRSELVREDVLADGDEEGAACRRVLISYAGEQGRLDKSRTQSLQKYKQGGSRRNIVGLEHGLRGDERLLHTQTRSKA